MVPQLSIETRKGFDMLIMRARFSSNGAQREFLARVMAVVGAPSLRELSRRVDVPYSTLKNYYIGARLMPFALYERLTNVSGVHVKVTFVEDSWGQVKGGKKSRR